MASTPELGPGAQRIRPRRNALVATAARCVLDTPHSGRARSSPLTLPLPRFLLRNRTVLVFSSFKHRFSSTSSRTPMMPVRSDCPSLPPLSRCLPPLPRCLPPSLQVLLLQVHPLPPAKLARPRVSLPLSASPRLRPGPFDNRPPHSPPPSLCLCPLCAFQAHPRCSHQGLERHAGAGRQEGGGEGRSPARDREGRWRRTTRDREGRRRGTARDREDCRRGTAGFGGDAAGRGIKARRQGGGNWTAKPQRCQPLPDGATARIRGRAVSPPPPQASASILASILDALSKKDLKAR